VQSLLVSHQSITHSLTQAQSKLYLTGIFHFAMSYTGSNFGVVSKLLHTTHLRQNHRDSANAVAAALALGKRSVLGESLPEAMLHIMENYGPEKFAEVFVGTFDTPEVIWNTDMRTHLVANIHQHLGDFPMQLRQNMSGKYNYCPMPGIQYPNLAKEVFCHNFFLRNLVDTTRFPEWPINDPIALFKVMGCSHFTSLLFAPKKLFVKNCCV
jgi:DnaJ family protein C protein 13